MKTNDLKKGQRILLKGTGWLAKLLDNKKGNIRMAEVHGIETECGSICATDIIAYEKSEGVWAYDLEFTDNQTKCAKLNKALFG